MAIRSYSERKSTSINQRLSSGDRDITGSSHVGHAGSASPSQTARRVLEQPNEVWSMEYSAANKIFGNSTKEDEKK